MITLSFNIEWFYLAWGSKKTIRRIQFINKETILPSITDDITFNIKNPEESTDKLGKLVRVN